MRTGFTDEVKAMTHQDSPLGTAPVGKLVLQLAIPAMLAQFVNILYSVVDRMYVGHIANAGDAALAGVGVCAPVVTMITALGALIGFGGGPLMSIRMGRRDMDGARQIVANSFYLLLALSVMATVPLLVFRRQILFTFGCSEALWEYAEAYFTTYVSGTVFAVMSYGLNQITMSQGFASTAMRSVMLGAAVNIALDPVFIFVLNMGVRGAALATVLSQICSTAYILRFLLGGKAAVGITRQPVNPGWMRRIVQVGLSPALIIALDPVFIFVLNMGVRGAALATVLSQICSTAYILRFLLGGKAAVGITRQPVNPGWMRRIVQVGLSPALIIALDNVLLISVNIMLRRYGGADSDMLIACAAVMQSFMLIITMPLGGITAGTQSILGYNYGAGNTKRIMQAFRGIILLCAVFCGLMFVLAQTVSGSFVRIFTRDPAYIDMASYMIRTYSLGVLGLAIQYPAVDGMTGMGLIRWGLTFSMLRKGLFLVCVFVLPPLFGVTAVMFSEPISDITAAVVSACGLAYVLPRLLRRQQV